MGPSELARFEEMLLPHLDDAYTLARYLVRDAQDAQDVVQDAYLRAVRHFASFRGRGEGRGGGGGGGGDGRAWLLAIVRNCARSWRRARRAAAPTTEFDDEIHSGEGTGEEADAALSRAEARETLRRALDALAPEFREAIVLRELNGLSYREIAAATRAPIGTVMSRLARARRKLLEALVPGGGAGKAVGRDLP